MDRTDQRTSPAMTAADIAAHQAASYVRPCTDDEDPNAPWLPKIPGPRKPRAATAPLNATAQQALAHLERALQSTVTA